MNINPIGPWPATITVSPGNRFRRFTALSTVFTGSSIAPSRKLFLRGIFTSPGRQNRMTRTYSAYPPPAGSKPAVMPVRKYCGHWA